MGRFKHRQVVIDTETTGLSKQKGHRVIELGVVELDAYHRTGERKAWRFDPGPDAIMDPRAQEVHGISLEDLKGEPTFDACKGEILDYLRACDLVGFNVNFDIGFLDWEFAKCDMSGHTTAAKFSIEKYARHDPNKRSAIDVRAMMKQRWKDKKWSLDSLCNLLDVDTSARVEHGALLDAELTAECYIRMMTGQSSMFKKVKWTPPEIRRVDRSVVGPLLVVRPTADELAAHEKFKELLCQQTQKEKLTA